MGGVFLKNKKSERGSIIVTLIIIAIFVGSTVFYLKTTYPSAYSTAISFVKAKVLQKPNLEDAVAEVYDAVKTPEAIEFDYLSSWYKTDTVVPLSNAVVTSRFGNRTDPVTGEINATHSGIDLAAPKGSEILCYKDGTVADVRCDSIYGNCVSIDHGDCKSFYAHLSKVAVNKGDSVSAGDSIGIIGSTGKSTGTHLHFELSIDNKLVDPAGYIYEKI